MGEFIDRFCRKTGFKLENPGEIGFGRPCVGIVNPACCSYVPYEITEHSGDYRLLFGNSVAPPDGAYHKGPYLAVLIEDGRSASAAREVLERWIWNIIMEGYILQPFKDEGTFGTLMGQSPDHVAVVNLQRIAWGTR